MQQSFKRIARCYAGALIAATAAVGCGDESMAAPEMCEDLADVWVIEDHCVMGFVTEMIPITQANCEIETRGAFSGFSGTLTEAGTLTLGGALGVMQVDCTGTYSTTQIDLNCTDDCAVRLVPQP